MFYLDEEITKEHISFVKRLESKSYRLGVKVDDLECEIDDLEGELSIAECRVNSLREDNASIEWLLEDLTPSVIDLSSDESCHIDRMIHPKWSSVSDCQDAYNKAMGRI